MSINKLICGASTTNQMIETVNGLIDAIESIRVGGVSELKALPVTTDMIGRIVRASEYNLGSGYGGALWEISTGEVANDISILQSSFDAGIQYVLHEKRVSPEAFGIYNDGTPNEVSRLKAFFESELSLSPSDNAIYSVDGVVDINDKNVSILDSTATFLFKTDDAQINFNYAYTDLQNVLSVDNAASINMSDGTAATETPVTKLTVADGSLYSAGDSVKVVADDVISGSDPLDSNRVGEHAHVYAVVGNDIYLGSRLVANGGNYTTNARIAKSSKKSFSCGSIQVDGDAASKNTRNVAHIVVRGCAHPSFSGRLQSKDTKATFLNILSCNEPQLSSVLSLNGVTDVSVGAFAHSVLLTSGTTNFYIGEVYGRRMRHLVDTTAYGTTSLDSVEKYGGVVGGVCSAIFGSEMQAAPASTHNDSDNIRFGNVVSDKPVHGVSGYPACVSFRGRNHSVVSAECFDGVGVYAFSDYNDPDNSRGHSAGRISVTGSGSWDRSRAFQVSGGTLANVDLSVDSVTWKSLDNLNRSYIGFAENGTVNVTTVNAFGGSINNTVSLFELSDNSSIEITSFTGRKLGSFNFSNFTSATANLSVDSADIETSVEWGRLAAMNNNSSTLRVKSFTVNTRGEASDLIKERGVTADIIADWVVLQDQNTAVRNRKRLSTISISSPLTYNIDVSDCGNEALFQKVVATATGGIGDITPGNFYGQEIIISNDFSSSSSFEIQDNVNGLRVASTITIQPSESLRIFWTGFQWVLS